MAITDTARHTDNSGNGTVDDDNDYDGDPINGFLDDDDDDGDINSNSKNKKKQTKKRRHKKKKATATVNGKTSNDKEAGHSSSKNKPRGQSAESKDDDDDLGDVEIEYIPAPMPDLGSSNSRVFQEFEQIFSRFAKGPEVDAEEGNEDDAEGEEAEGDETAEQNEDGDGDEEEGEDGTKALSNKKKRLLQRLSVAQLKQLVKKPDVVDWVDVTAADPKLLVHLKGYRNTVPIPIHWQQKRKYLQGKRGIEKAPFDLPDFIKATGIMDMRQTGNEAGPGSNLKTKMRERMQPRMGKLDIDYQKLHDAFFRWQTKPRLSGYGEMYFEGKEYETKLKTNKPGQLSEELKAALNIPPLAPPPWLINMQRYGPPPSYPGLKIPGLNAPIPEGAIWGYLPGGWGKPPVDEYGRPIYGDVFGIAKSDLPADIVHIDRTTWGELEADEEAEEYGEEEEEEELQDEETASSVGGPRHDEFDVPRDETGLVTPSGIASSVVGGMETPDYIELRKEARRDEPPRELYKVLPQKDVAVRGFMGSQHTYDLSDVSSGSTLDDPSASSNSRKRKNAPGGVVTANERVEVALNPEDLEEGLGSDAVRRAYEGTVQQRKDEQKHEDFSDMVAEHAQKQAAKKRRKEDDERGRGSKGGSSGKREKFKF